MKRTLACFLAALSLVIVAIAAPQRATPATSQLALDTDGVRELRVESDARVSVTIGHAPPLASWPGDGRGDVSARREGDVLHVSSTREGYQEVQLTVPPGIRVVEIGDGTITVAGSIPALTVRVGGSLQFDGNVDRLAIEDRDGPDCRTTQGCSRQVSIGGDIGELVVTAHAMAVTLNSPGEIGRAELRLGRGAVFSLGSARTLDNIRIVQLDAVTIAPVDPD